MPQVGSPPPQLRTEPHVKRHDPTHAPPTISFSRAVTAASGRGRGPQEVLDFLKTDASVSGVMAASTPEGVAETQDGKRRQFGNRFLSDPARVFRYNAW